MFLQTRLLRFSVALALAAQSVPAAGHPPKGTVENFGPNLQEAAAGVCRQPEGIAVDPAGNLYVASNSDSATIGHVCVIDPEGTIRDIIEVHAGSSPVIGLLGELWEDGQLYVLDQADNVVPNGRVLRIDLRSHAVTQVASGFAFPNAIAEDRRGNRYVSDSLLGSVFRLPPDDSSAAAWATSPLLRSSNPDQNVGANGIAFDRGERFLYVANTGNRQIFRFPVEPDGSAGAIELFVDGAAVDREMGFASPVALFGADGIQFDVRKNLYVLANQANEIQVYSPRGRLVARYSGAGQNALDFPASLVFRGRELFITNMSAADGGVGSKLSLFQAPHPGLPLK